LHPEDHGQVPFARRRAAAAPLAGDRRRRRGQPPIAVPRPLLALRHVGVPDEAVGWAEVLFVFASTRLLTVVRFTPGGAGVVEALLIAGLVAAGGQQDEVAAAVLVFRGLTWLLPVPIGGLTYLAWRRQQARRRTSATDAASVADA
jgi:uncharacterized membrane protein YbhN (UPF0104 family)